MMFVVVAESDADAAIAQELTDRVVYDQTGSWCHFDHINTVRSWTDLDGRSDPTDDRAGTRPVFTKWTHVKTLAREKNVRNLGFLPSGSPGGIDSAQSRKAILLFEKLRREQKIACALILVRDMDTQPERRHGMEQARQSRDAKPFDIIIGAANPKREAWVLNGFDPENKAEEAALEIERRKIGGDPRTHAHTLTASQTGAKRNAKRVVKALISSSEREAECWKSTDLDTLRERGTKTGLTDFLDELRALVKHFDPAAS